MGMIEFIEKIVQYIFLMLIDTTPSDNVQRINVIFPSWLKHSVNSNMTTKDNFHCSTTEVIMQRKELFTTPYGLTCP